jgi:hypothetical protein
MVRWLTQAIFLMCGTEQKIAPFSISTVQYSVVSNGGALHGMLAHVIFLVMGRTGDRSSFM